MSTFETILYEEERGVARITLHRPSVHNAFNLTMQMELHQVWASLRRNDDVNAVVLTGAGENAFCSGVDRKEAIGDGTPDDASRNFDRAQVGYPGASRFMLDVPRGRLGPKSNDLWKPVICAVNGMAVGGAFYMIGESDIIIAADNATFFDSHVTFDLASANETVLMAQRMPLGEVLRMQLVGNRERMSARRAYEIGLVSEVVPHNELVERATALAEEIAELAPSAVQGTLRAVWATRQMPLAQALDLAYAFIGLGNTHEGEARGQRAFLAGKRKPHRVR